MTTKRGAVISRYVAAGVVGLLAGLALFVILFDRREPALLVAVPMLAALASVVFSTYGVEGA